MNKAYLVIDMSNDFVDDNGSLSVGKKAQAIVPAVLRRINKFYNDNDCRFGRKPVKFWQI